MRLLLFQGAHNSTGPQSIRLSVDQSSAEQARATTLAHHKRVAPKPTNVA
ncbi:hypothetical protein Z947_3151 [Sulfitobacter geojensis]|nr:hypothetical protein Z947_3151 [Sulfitobacter geojensis]